MTSTRTLGVGKLGRRPRAEDGQACDSDVAESHPVIAVGKHRAAGMRAGDTMGKDIAIRQVERGLEAPYAIDEGQPVRGWTSRLVCLDLRAVLDELAFGIERVVGAHKVRRPIGGRPVLYEYLHWDASRLPAGIRYWPAGSVQSGDRCDTLCVTGAVQPPFRG